MTAQVNSSWEIWKDIILLYTISVVLLWAGDCAGQLVVGDLEVQQQPTPTRRRDIPNNNITEKTRLSSNKRITSKLYLLKIYSYPQV